MHPSLPRVRGDALKLPFDVSRCGGGTEATPCPVKDECARYTDRLNTGSRAIPIKLRFCAKTENQIESKA